MKKCLETHKKDIKENVEMQKLLSELSEISLTSTIEKIQSSIFYEKFERMKILLTSIGIFVKIRRERIKCFFQLIEAIMPRIVQIFSKDEIMSLFKRKEIHLKLLKDKFLTIQDIVTYYGLKNRKLACFYPELLEISNDYPTIISDLKQSQKYRDVIEYFTTSNEQKGDPRLGEGNYDYLSIIIQKDDIESFQKYSSHNDIKIPTHQIDITSFETNKCFTQSRVYLIEYAAYHCSLKIFKFLLMNNASFSKMLLRCAICGGNSEIIHMSENAIHNASLHHTKSDILSMSIAFHRYDITEYLIESCGIGIEYNDWLNSILSSNYFFFFNHILDYNNEYNRLLKLHDIGRLVTDGDENFKYNEVRDKANELALIAVQNVDPFFLKVVSCFDGINLNLTGSYGLNQKKITCPLVLAIQSRNIENVKFLLNLDSVDPDWKVVNNTTPFLWACYIGDIEIVELLINNFYYKKNQTKNSNEIIGNNNKAEDSNEAVNNDNTTDDLNKSEKSNGTDSFIQSNKSNSFDSNKNIDLSMSENSSFVKKECISLNSSYESCDFSSTEELKEKNDLNKFENEILIDLNQSKNRSINIMQLVDQSDENALHLATRECHLDVVKYLVSLNVYDLNQQNSQGETCIQIAARLGYREIFKFLKSALIQSGIKIDENIKVNEHRFLPQLHIKPLAMGLNLFDNLKEPISICLLI